jgi:hypothetical protein
MPPIASAIFEKPMKIEIAALSSTIPADVKCASISRSSSGSGSGVSERKRSVQRSTAFWRGVRSVASKPSSIFPMIVSERPSCFAPAKRVLFQTPQSTVRALRIRAISFVEWSRIPWLQSVP